MNRLFATVILSLFAATAAFAQDPTPEQKRMNYCNSEATHSKLKGDQRKSFVKTCVGKVESCAKQADAKMLKATDYIKFVGDCVKP